MDEYIKREAAIKTLLNDAPEQVGYSREDAADCIRYMDAADVASVRHGRWIDKPTGRYGQWQAWCSECNERCGCGGTIKSQHKIFCPNCGAKMDLNDLED